MLNTIVLTTDSLEFTDIMNRTKISDVRFKDDETSGIKKDSLIKFVDCDLKDSICVKVNMVFSTEDSITFTFNRITNSYVSGINM